MSVDPINLSRWQDFRGKNESVFVYLNTVSSHVLPIRDIVNEFGKGYQTEPNIETGTYNFIGEYAVGLCNSAVKNKRRYLFFSTCYQGLIEDLRGKYLIFGYYRIDKTVDARKRHMHFWMEQGEQNEQPESMELSECSAVYSEDFNFFLPSDSFELSEAVMVRWGYKGRVAKHMKLTFDEPKTSEILKHFSGKNPINDQYLVGIKELEKIREAAVAEVVANAKEVEDTEEW